MSKPKYRALGFCSVPTLVENTEDYKKSMAFIHTHDERREDLNLADGEYKIASLYKVIRPDDITLYVLAENAERAIGQACCEFNNYSIKPEIEAKCLAFKLPLMLQGWGAEKI